MEVNLILLFLLIGFLSLVISMVCSVVLLVVAVRTWNPVGFSTRSMSITEKLIFGFVIITLLGTLAVNPAMVWIKTSEIQWLVENLTARYLIVFASLVLQALIMLLSVVSGPRILEKLSGKNP